MARVGQEQFGDWKKLTVLGSGGFGQVSLWQNVNDGKKIAIKMCKQQLGERSLQRWQQEVDIMKNMKHESIVGFHEVPQAIQDNYVINYVALGMEYCELGDLRRMLSQAKNCCGIQEFQVRDFLDNIGSAIHFLHEKSIVHRDLKPENIVMKSVGKEKIQFKIIDLGYAKDLSEQTSLTSFVGTLHYLAPEFSSVQPLRYTKTVDFWSFGLVAFECMTGRRPFFPHLEAMQFITILKENKLDEHICTAGDNNDQTPRFLSYIPQPHALNPVFADKIRVWLQKMLLMDAKRRGGGDGSNGWFKNLQEILAQKHINVYNTQTHSMLTIEASPGMRIQGLQQQVTAKTNIPIDSQVLLLKNGERPNVMRLAVDECWRTPSNDPWNVYLYSDEEFQVPSLQLPNELKNMISGRRAQAQPKETRRALCLAINFINSQCKRCLEAVSALRAIKSSVQKHYSHFNSSGEELKGSYFRFYGVLEFFEKSLKTDVDYYEDLFKKGLKQLLRGNNRPPPLVGNKPTMDYDDDDDNDDDNIIENWTRHERELEQYKRQELPLIKSTIEKANVFNSRINVGAFVKKAEEFCNSTSKSLAERIQQSAQKFDEVKKKIHLYQDHNRRRSERDPAQIADDIHSTMKDLANGFLQRITTEITQYYVDTSNQIRILLKYLKDLRKVMGETNFADKTHQLNRHIKSLFDLHQFRQQSIWGVMQRLKEEKEEMDKVMLETPFVESISNDTENTESLRLTDEMDHNVRQFGGCINDLTNDREILLNWDILLIDSASRVDADPPAENDYHPPQADHSVDAVPQAVRNANTNNNNSNNSIEVSPEITANDLTGT